jgi:hypothetical protein
MEAGDRVHLRRLAAVGARAALPRPAVTGDRVAVVGVPAAARLLRPPRHLRAVGVGIMPTTPRGVAALPAVAGVLAALRPRAAVAALPVPAPVAR